jgi:hypothetical protein
MKLEIKNATPSKEKLQYRIDMFGYLMGQALGSKYIGSQSPHARLLELELERCYCSGAWYACIVLACAAVEDYVNFQGNKKVAKFLSRYDLREEWIWLTNKRKYIVHPNQHSPTSNGYFEVNNQLQKEAERAISLTLKVLLLGTNEEMEGSSPRNT